MITVTSTSTKYSTIAERTYTDLADLIDAITDIPGAAVLSIDASQDYDIASDGDGDHQCWLGAPVWDAYHGREGSSGLYNVDEALECAAGLEADLRRHKCTRRIWIILGHRMTQDANIVSYSHVDFEIK